MILVLTCAAAYGVQLCGIGRNVEIDLFELWYTCSSVWAMDEATINSLLCCSINSVVTIQVSYMA